jgi:flagellar hook-associated protein 3 FlgL
MRILFDVLRDGLASINTAADQMNAARQQVTTGRRVTAPSDDPLAAQQAIGEYATMGGLDAYKRSADSAAARLAAADTVLGGFVDKLTAGIVAAMSGRGTEKTPAERSAAAAEVRQLRAALVSDINSTFRGSYLFSGTVADAPAYVASGGGYTYQGNNASTQIEIDRGRLVTVSFDGQAIAQGSDAVDVFTAMDDLANAIEAGDDAAVGAGMDALERAFDRASRLQGRLGADERGVDEATQRLAALRLAAENRRSKLEDANMADAITRMNEADTAYRAALGAVSSAERVSLLDYLR